MEINQTKNKTIAKNTIFMYIRMGVTMIVGLYTSRVVLQQLGIEDYGLYNVISGIIAMLGFINGAMVNTTLRFITVYIAKENEIMLNNIFSMSFIIHLIIAAIILLLGETVGLWYLNNKLIVPEGREFVAHCLFQLSAVTCILSILYVPYNATIVAHEKMDTFAYISIMDVMLKLIIVISLSYSPIDKLLFYGMLLAMVSVLDLSIYFIYCHRTFAETKLKFYWNNSIFKEMMSFVGWAFVGNFSYLFYSQGINLMLNAFCGPAVNAARGIAVQVEGVVKQFANNVQMAINPQIIKSYTSNDIERTYTLIFASSKYCFYLLFIVSLPIIIEADFILKLWLGIVPDHTVNFIRLILSISILDAFINPMYTANLASGKLKIYHLSLTILMYSFMFITFFSIKISLIPESVFICLLLATIIGVIMRVFILEKQINLSKSLFITKVLKPVSYVIITSLILPTISHIGIPNDILRFLITSFLSVCSVGFSIFFIGINASERQYALNYIKIKISNFKRQQCTQTKKTYEY